MNWTTYNSAGAALSQSLTDMPVGTITGYAGTTAPSGWLLCDGSAVSRTTYAELFGVVSTTYGSGDGSTTFNVPDSSGFIILASSQAARLAAAALPQYVTSLPSSPVDGQTVVYAADATNGVMWTLRYRAASSSSYKWESVSSTPIYVDSLAEVGNTVLTDNVWSDISSAVSLTIPLSGEYIVESTSSIYSGTAVYVRFGIRNDATDPVATSNDASTLLSATAWANVSQRRVMTITANKVIKVRYLFTNSGGTGGTGYRRNTSLYARPVRVG